MAALELTTVKGPRRRLAPAANGGQEQRHGPRPLAPAAAHLPYTPTYTHTHYTHDTHYTHTVHAEFRAGSLVGCRRRRRRRRRARGRGRATGDMEGADETGRRRPELAAAPVSWAAPPAASHLFSDVFRIRSEWFPQTKKKPHVKFPVDPGAVGRDPNRYRPGVIYPQVGDDFRVRSSLLPLTTTTRNSPYEVSGGSWWSRGS